LEKALTRAVAMDREDPLMKTLSKLIVSAIVPYISGGCALLLALRSPRSRSRLGARGAGLGLLATVLAIPVAALHGAVFQGLGNALDGYSGLPRPIRVSGNGKVVYGDGGFRWTVEEGIEYLPSVQPGAKSDPVFIGGVSWDGSAVAGDIGLLPFLWSNSGIQKLPITVSVAAGQTPGFAFPPPQVSGDGSVVVWAEHSSSGYSQVTRWTRETGAESLFRAGPSSVWGISKDASTIVGSAADEAFRWSVPGRLEYLGPGAAYDTSHDGAVIVGGTEAVWGRQAVQPFRWTSDGGVEHLGTSLGAALATSCDGRIIVGSNYDGANGRAFYWTPSTGMRDLQEMIAADYGLDLSGWQVNSATDISGDGRTIVGYGINPSGQREGWIFSKGMTHILGAGVEWVDLSGSGSEYRGDITAQRLVDGLSRTLVGPVRSEVVTTCSLFAGGLSAFKESLRDFLDSEAIQPGDTLILSVATHGGTSRTGDEPAIWTHKPVGGQSPISTVHPYPPPPAWGEWCTGHESLAFSMYPDDDLYDNDADLHRLLGDPRLADVKKIVLLDACRSGGFGPNLTDGSIPNIAVLASCNEGYFGEYFDDGTGMFTNYVLLGLQPRPGQQHARADSDADGLVGLLELEDYLENVLSCDPSGWGHLVGTELPLAYVTGTGVFHGLDVEFFASPDFTGGFRIGAARQFAVPEPSSIALMLAGVLAVMLCKGRRALRRSGRSNS